MSFLGTDLLGVPFQWGGRDPAKGLDCLGLVLEVYGRMGLRETIPDPRNGWRDVTRGIDRIGEGLRERGWRSVRISDLAPGHLIVLASDPSKVADHLAIYLGERRMLHATETHGVVVEPLSVIAARSITWVGAFAPPKPMPRSQEPSVALSAPVLLCDEPVCALSQVLLKLQEDPLMRPREAVRMEIPVVGTERLCDLVPVGWQSRPARQVVALDQTGEVVPLERRVTGGQGYTLMLVPGGLEVATAKALALGLFLSFANFLITFALRPGLEKPSDNEGQGSPTFRLDGIRNTALTGVPIPIVYGEHLVGGNVIGIFFNVDENGRQVLNMLIALSQGPVFAISGLEGEQDRLSGTSIPETIKLNGTPAREFQSVRVSTRVGTEDQSPIPGFAQTVQAVPYSITLGQNQPFTHTTQDPVDALQVIIAFPAGLFRITSSGASGPIQTTIQYRWRPVGSAAWSSQTVNYRENRRAPFSRQFDVTGLARDRYEIEITRLAGPWPSAFSEESDQSDLVAVNEIIDDALSYPGIALLAIQAMSDEQLPGGAPPTVTSIVTGRQVYRYQQITRTFVPAQRADNSYRNPAWVVLDLLIHPIYGLAVGGGLSIANIDIESFLEWAALASTSVEDGRGGTMSRAQCDTVLDSARSGWETALAIARSHFADLAVVGTKIRAVPMKARDPVALFTMSQTSDFSLQVSSRATRPNVVEADFTNAEIDFENDTAQRVDPQIFSGANVVKESLALIGVTRPGQAYRMVQFRLNHAELIKSVCRFTAGVEAIHLLPGDVIRVAHSAMRWGTSGRARSSGTNTIVLDRDVTLTAGDRIAVRTSGTGADVLQTRDVVTTGAVAAGSPITVTPAWDAGDEPTQGDPFSVGAPSRFVREFQIDSIETSEDLRRVVNAKQYDPAVFDDDPGVVETFTDEMPDARQIPQGLRSVHAVELALQADDGSAISGVEVYVAKSQMTAAVDVFWRITAAADPGVEAVESRWVYAGRTAGDRISFIGPGYGQHITVSAVPVSPQGVSASADTGIKADLALVGRTQRPTSAAALDGFCVVPTGDDVLLGAPVHPDRDVDVFDVFWGTDQTTLAGATPVGVVRCGQTTIIPFRDVGPGKLLLFAPRNRRGLRGKAKAVPLSLSIPATLRMEFTHDEHPAWGGVGLDAKVSGGSLFINDGFATAEYESNAIPFSDGVAHRAAVIAKDFTRLEQRLLAFEVAGFRFDDERYADMTFDASYQLGYENDTPLSFADADFAFEAALAEVISFDRHVDLIEATRPVVEVDYFDGASWIGFDKSEPRDVSGIEQVAVKLTLNAPTTGQWWRPEVYGLTVQGLVRDGGKLEVQDLGADYGDGSSALTVASGFQQLGLVARERYRRWPALPTSAAQWSGTAAPIGTPVGNHGGFCAQLRNGFIDSISVDVPTPAWAQDLSGTDFLEIVITWVGSAITGATARDVAFWTFFRPWTQAAGPATIDAISGTDVQLATVPSGYTPGDVLTSVLRVRKSAFVGAASLNGNATPRQMITVGVGRQITSDTYMSIVSGNVYVLSVEVRSAYKVT